MTKAEARRAELFRKLGYADITSGLGIGGAGSDDYNIHTEADTSISQDDGTSRYVYPNGGTQGIRTPGTRCRICGVAANWNSGAGQHLCARHWDEY